MKRRSAPQFGQGRDMLLPLGASIHMATLIKVSEWVTAPILSRSILADPRDGPRAATVAQRQSGGFVNRTSGGGSSPVASRRPRRDTAGPAPPARSSPPAPALSPIVEYSPVQVHGPPSLRRSVRVPRRVRSPAWSSTLKSVHPAYASSLGARTKTS